MSTPTLEPVSVPLHQDASGALRIADTRVLLELIVRAFRAGATPEEIVQAYDTLKLRDVYSVVAWCLNNESAVADYMADRELQASAVQKEIETLRPGGTDILKSLRDRVAGTGA
ncbi:MAG: DUF433 domain-containing protein [Planctomycetota bacterium]|nr:DUF433 domain-containing protein [Planctomycetota bacterium]